MKKNEIQVGGLYTAKVANKVTTVRVDAIREMRGLGMGNPCNTRWDVTNMVTGRKTTFRSAAKFRGVAKPIAPTNVEEVTGRVLAGETGLKVEQVQQIFDATDRAKLLEDESRSKPTNIAGIRCPKCGRGEWDTRKDLLDPAEDWFRCKICKHEWRRYGEEGAETATIPVVCNKTIIVPEAETILNDLTILDESRKLYDALSTNPLSKVASAIASAAHVAPTRKHPLTDEQQAIVDAAPNEPVLVIEAGAGAGKTSTLVELTNVLKGNGQYTAFNASLVAESGGKFPIQCRCNTIHSLAFRQEGIKYKHRMNQGRTRSSEVAAMLGITDMTVAGVDGKEKRLDAGVLASMVTRAVKSFCQSDEREVGLHHFGSMAGISQASEAMVKQAMLPFAIAMWTDVSSPGGRLPFAHDHYVKVWQLNDPIIAADYVLLDEAQDTSPVMLDVLAQQVRRGTRVILVGDSAQQIYSWRGAVNALAAFPDARRLMLSQSFRFGPVIAEVANAVLGHLTNRTPLVMRGFDKVPSRLSHLSEPQAVLCRTNAAAVQTMLTAIQNNRRAHLIGGGSDVLTFVNGARDLQTGRKTSHPELACFESWGEVQGYVKTDEGEDLKLMVKLIDQFGAEKIAGALKNMPAEKDADLVISTAHKSKGREWDTVKLAGDFMPLDKMGDEELRLLYVAATRAKRVLDVESCPPFSLGAGNDDEDDRDQRGKVINISKARRLSGGVVVTDEPTPAAVEQAETVEQPRQEEDRRQAMDNTWSKGKDGKWRVRGLPGQSLQTVTVTRRNGSKSKERLGKVVWQDETVALYDVIAK